MIDLRNETTLTLNEARRLPYLKGRAGNRVSICTLHRWTTRGVAGVVLETLKAGGTLLTSVEAIDRFVTRLSNPIEHAPQRADANRRRQVDAAHQKLNDAGFRL